MIYLIGIRHEYQVSGRLQNEEFAQYLQPDSCCSLCDRGRGPHDFGDDETLDWLLLNSEVS